jgi:hypothetical protein
MQAQCAPAASGPSPLVLRQTGFWRGLSFALLSASRLSAGSAALPLITSTSIEGSLNRRLALMRYILSDMTQIGLAVISTKAFFVQGWNDGNPDRQD